MTVWEFLHRNSILVFIFLLIGLGAFTVRCDNGGNGRGASISCNGQK